jgi:hypothetical protein
MNNVQVPIELTPDISALFDDTDEKLAAYAQVGLALMLYVEGKVSIGAAVQLSKTTRYKFEQLIQNFHPAATEEEIVQVNADVAKLMK